MGKREEGSRGGGGRRGGGRGERGVRRGGGRVGGGERGESRGRGLLRCEHTGGVLAYVGLRWSYVDRCCHTQDLPSSTVETRQVTRARVLTGRVAHSLGMGHSSNAPP